MDLAAQALENLVNQFARPMDFLRELVQNALDAGSPRIEVAVRWSGGADHGVVTIHVDDFGAGMNEDIIDHQLTTLFASSKEGDLTKIGKFGIGFTSVFALRPKAVLVVTGRDGEGWEVLFHEDRSFDKVRLDTPQIGTKITLFKEMARAEVPVLVAEARRSLVGWCEHASRPITFADETSANTGAPPGSGDEGPAGAEPAGALADADPFAAFAEAPVDPGPRVEPINRPFGLADASLTVAMTRGETEVVVGYTPSPRYGWYNAGLTLLSTEMPEALGGFANRLQHVSLKVRSARLKHTLTRDNVTRDATWEAAMEVVVAAADTLRERLIAAAVEGGPDRGAHLRALADEAAADPSWARRSLRDAAVLPVHGGRATLSQLEVAEDTWGAVVVHPVDPRLADSLHAEGVLLAEPDTVALLRALPPPPRLGVFRRERTFIQAEDAFAFPNLARAADLSPEEERLLAAAAPRVQAASHGRVRLDLGDLPGLSDLLVEGDEGGRLYLRRPAWWHRWIGYTRPRRLVLNRAHPQVRALASLASAYPLPAGVALAALALVEEGLVSLEAARAVLPPEAP